MFQLPLATSSTEVAEDKFWKSVLLYYNKPHVVNRRLFGISPVLFLEVDFRNESTKRVTEMFTRPAILYEARKLPKLTKEHINKDLIQSILEPYDKEVVIEDATLDEFLNSKESVYVSVRILLSRVKVIENCIEIVVLDKLHKVATFFAVAELDKKSLGPPFAYDIEYTAAGNVRICVQNFEDTETAAAEWLVDQLFPKIVKWTEDLETDGIKQSLALVPMDAYTELYHSLKHKYSNDIIKKWTENTDPLKFVHEDIAIATYLILLWTTRSPGSKSSFVDLGCGNGLLVHILNSEGFPGSGIDVRKRKIWDTYPRTTQLEVQTITPSASFLFPETDWIIGNHSDELTPWIPVIAARSSYKTNFFLLPCCSYQFNGQKYMRKNTSVSVYTDYLNYLKQLCAQCGFLTDVDKLRIPSTKRTCIVSSGRSYLPEEFSKIDEDIAELLQQQSTDKDSNWVNDFQARPNVEQVRNCTRLNRSLVNAIIKRVVEKLLEETSLKSKPDGATWNAGGMLLLSDLAKFLGGTCLKELKEECGGLKTLLKNHRYIFEVIGGSVRLRVPATCEETNGKYKEKFCWFHVNHPQGCFNDFQICAYSHS